MRQISSTILILICMLSVTCNAQKKYSKGNQKKLWKITNYKTGDIPNCLKFIPSIK